MKYSHFTLSPLCVCVFATDKQLRGKAGEFE